MAAIVRAVAGGDCKIEVLLVPIQDMLPRTEILRTRIGGDVRGADLDLVGRRIQGSSYGLAGHEESQSGKGGDFELHSGGIRGWPCGYGLVRECSGGF